MSLVGLKFHIIPTNIPDLTETYPKPHYCVPHVGPGLPVEEVARPLDVFPTVGGLKEWTTG